MLLARQTSADLYFITLFILSHCFLQVHINFASLLGVAVINTMSNSKGFIIAVKVKSIIKGSQGGSPRKGLKAEFS